MTFTGHWDMPRCQGIEMAKGLGRRDHSWQISTERLRGSGSSACRWHRLSTRPMGKRGNEASADRAAGWTLPGSPGDDAIEHLKEASWIRNSTCNSSCYNLGDFRFIMTGYPGRHHPYFSVGFSRSQKPTIQRPGDIPMTSWKPLGQRPSTARRWTGVPAGAGFALDRITHYRLSNGYYPMVI